MLKSNRSDGFTIIEITIAVTLIMGGLIVAMVAINSRLRQENFYKGATRFGSTLNDILNDVSTGNWPHVDGWACQLDSNQDIEFIQAPGHRTGDGDCLYVGKVIQFGDKTTRKITEDDGAYIVHTVMTHRNALIPIYDFDKISQTHSDSDRSSPLATLEKSGTPGFSSRETKSWPHGMQIEQAYYTRAGGVPTNIHDRVYLLGIAVVHQSGHGLKENDLLLQLGAGRVGIRVIPDVALPGVQNPNALRPDSDDFAASLKRTPKSSTGTEREMVHDFSLPIYICFGDGKGRQALGELGGQFGSFSVDANFDENDVNSHCN